MPADLFFRTEDIQVDEILQYLVESDNDRQIIDHLKGRSPVILRGSRGVGKSFLLRAAEAELTRDFSETRILPVYLTFARASLITKPTSHRFLNWMLAKICNRIIRAGTTAGLTLPAGSAISAIYGGSASEPSVIERVERFFEEAWRTNSTADPELDELPSPDLLRDAVEDLCKHGGLKRVALFVDEAAHVFIPQQQRQFFTLMRDLRSPFLSIKAAVYPGATAFGDTFQPTHDATLLTVDRNVSDDGYASTMRELVLRQDRALSRAITQYGEVFDVLAYASTGNPRILLKTVARSLPFNRKNAQDTIREYYREEIWAEHSSLADRYPGHRELIDWGRRFIESQVLPDLYERNRKHSNGVTSSYLWIHRDAPQAVREALRLLCYSGILQEGVSGIRATRSEVGTRYMINLGCQIALDSEPVSYGTLLRGGLSVRRMIEYGANHPSYRPIESLTIDKLESVDNQALQARLGATIGLLDITNFQRQKLQELGLETIGSVLASNEQEFMQAHYVGPARARQMRNAAVAAVLEYLSG